MMANVNISNIIKKFEEIRDIPYRIPLSISEEDNCCSGKAKKLKKILEDEGYLVRYRVCDFKWSESSLPQIPSAVRSVPHNTKPTHVYLEVKINNKWINLDPTWDSGIAHIFPISVWDGVSSTRIAVKPLRLHSPEESRKIMEETSDEEEEDYLKENKDFYKAFNDWLESERKNKK